MTCDTSPDSTATTGSLTYARAILERGGAGQHTPGIYAVIPLNGPEKRPAAGWSQSAGVRIETLADLDARWPAAHPWHDGIAVIPLARAFILDVDGKREAPGYETLAALRDELNATDTELGADTAIVTASRAGEHRFFAARHDLPAIVASSPRGWTGLDVRAGGAAGYVATGPAYADLPPPVADLPEPPAGLVETLTPSGQREPSSRPGGDREASHRWVAEPDQPINVQAVRDHIRRLSGLARSHGAETARGGRPRNEAAFRLAAYAGDLAVTLGAVEELLHDPGNNGEPDDTETTPAELLFPAGDGDGDFTAAELSYRLRNGHAYRHFGPFGHGSRAPADVAVREPAPATITTDRAPDEAAGELREAVTDWVNRGGKQSIVTTAGVGKTQVAISQLLVALYRRKAGDRRPRDEDGLPVKIAYALPEHSMTAELLETVDALAETLGVRVKVWHGQDRLCSNTDLLKAVRNTAGLSGTDACDACPLKAECPFTEQRNADADLWIVSHASLTNAPPFKAARETRYRPWYGDEDEPQWLKERVSTIWRLVIDENPATALLPGVETPIRLSLDDLGAERVHGGGKVRPDVPSVDEVGAAGATMAAVLRCLPDGPIERASLPSWCEPHRLRNIATGEWQVIPPEPRKRDRTAAGAVGEVPAWVSGMSRGRLRSLASRRARFWHLLADFIEKGEAGPCPYLELATRERDGDGTRTVFMRWMAAISPGWWENGDVLALDATGDPEIIECWLGEAKHLDLPAAQLGESVTTRHIPVNTARGRLTADQTAEADDDTAEGDSAAESPAERAQRLRKNLGAAIETTGAAVIGNRDLTGPDGLLPGQPRAHFNALRGRNHLREVDHLMVIGRPMPKAQDVARYASALTGRWIDPSTPYIPVLRPLYDRHGHVISTVQSRKHPDDMAERVRRQICEAEVEQAVHRARPARRDAGLPVIIDIISTDVAVQVPVDHALAAHELPVNPDHIAEARGLLVETLAALQAVVADYWPSVNAVRRYYQRHGLTRRVPDDAPAHWRLWAVKAPEISRKRFRVAAPPEFGPDDIAAKLGVTALAAEPAVRAFNDPYPKALAA